MSTLVNGARLMSTSVAPAKIDLSQAFNFTGGLQSGGAAVATESYVQSVAQGANLKLPVIAATTANIGNLATAAPDTLDGVSLEANDRVLVKDQTDATQNGIYVVTTLGTGADGVWTRASDNNSSAEIASTYVFVEEGTNNADTAWYMTSNSPVLGTDNVVFQQYNALGQVTGGDGINKSGNTLNLDIASTQPVYISGGQLAFRANSSAFEFDGSGNLSIKNSGVIEQYIADLAVSNGKLAGSIAFSKLLNTDVPSPTDVTTGAAASSNSGTAPMGVIRANPWKGPVRRATTTALPAYTRTGNTILADALGALPSIDSTSMGAGQRILLKNGAADADNGVYVITVLGDGSTAFELKRASDFDETGDVAQGAYVPVGGGTANGGKVFACGAVTTLNTTSITFSEQYAAGNGLSKSSGSLAVLLDSGSGLAVSGTGLKIDAGGVTKAMLNSDVVGASGGIQGGAGTGLSLKMARNTYTGDAATTTFAIGGTPITNGLFVWAGGTLMSVSASDYSISGTNVVFTAAPANSEQIDIFAFIA